MKNNIDKFYKNWCKQTKRGGGVLVGSSIKELLEAFQKEVLKDVVIPDTKPQSYYWQLMKFDKYSRKKW